VQPHQTQCEHFAQAAIEAQRDLGPRAAGGAEGLGADGEQLQLIHGRDLQLGSVQAVPQEARLGEHLPGVQAHGRLCAAGDAHVDPALEQHVQLAAPVATGQEGGAGWHLQSRCGLEHPGQVFAGDLAEQLAAAGLQRGQQRVPIARLHGAHAAAPGLRAKPAAEPLGQRRVVRHREVGRVQRKRHLLGVFEIAQQVHHGQQQAIQRVRHDTTVAAAADRFVQRQLPRAAGQEGDLEAALERVAVDLGHELHADGRAAVRRLHHQPPQHEHLRLGQLELLYGKERTLRVVRGQGGQRGHAQGGERRALVVEIGQDERVGVERFGEGLRRMVGARDVEPLFLHADPVAQLFDGFVLGLVDGDLSDRHGIRS